VANFSTSHCMAPPLNTQHGGAIPPTFDRMHLSAAQLRTQRKCSGLLKFCCPTPGRCSLLCVIAPRSQLFAKIHPNSNPDALGKSVDLYGAGLPVYIDCAFRHGSGPGLGRTVERYAYSVPTPPFPATKLALGESCASGRTLVRRPMSNLVLQRLRNG
jgi:hypothetical protein